MIKYSYTEMTGINKGYRQLANAIVLLACKDYRAALRRNNQRSIAELERFFRSDWCNTLCTVNPEQLITKIRSDVKGRINANYNGAYHGYNT